MALYKAFGELKSLVSSKPDSIDVIDTTFRLHKLTGIILLGCTILISLKQYVGENIHCYHTADIKDDMFESFCFITSTFSLPVDEKSGHMASHPGVYHQGDRPDESFNTFHNYYLWVAFVLFGQALAFYIPYQLWKVKEGGKLKKQWYQWAGMVPMGPMSRNGTNGARMGQMGPEWDKWGQNGKNGTNEPEWDKWGQNGTNGARMGQMRPMRRNGTNGSEWDKWGQNGTNGARMGQMGPEWDKWDQ